MRISTRMFQQRALSSLRAGESTLYKAQSEVADGRRVRTVSDDPDAAARILCLDGQLRDITQYQRNASVAGTRMKAEDDAISAARKLISQARGLAVSITTEDPASPDRQAALASLEQIRQELVALGNTRDGNGYLFGGGRSTTPPFLGDGTYVGDGTVRQTEIDSGVLVDTNHTGDQLFTNALRAVRDLEQQLGSSTLNVSQSAVTSFDAVATELLSAQSVNGARLQQVQSVAATLTQRSATLADTRDGLQNVDPTEASVELLAAQSALERAYAAIGKVLSTNLLDYLS